MLVAELNWNVVLPTAVTGATASLVALFNWLGNRTTAASANRQVEAEAQRLREQRDEEHLQHRQGLYHDLLNRERAELHVLADETKTPEERTAAVIAIQELLNNALLFGTHDVASRAAELAAALAPMRRAALQGEPLPGTPWFDLRRELINAMRHDVSADRSPVEWPGRLD
jgi:hypothetical protein